MKNLITVVGREYIYFSIDPYLFSLGKRDKLFKIIQIIIIKLFSLIKKMRNSTYREYVYISINPYFFILGKKDYVFKIFENKTREQKVLLIVTLGFLILDSFILFADFFAGGRLKTYLSFLILQAIIKFMILMYFNPYNALHNFKAALPYIGGVYVMYFFSKSKNNKTQTL